MAQPFGRDRAGLGVAPRVDLLAPRSRGRRCAADTSADPQVGSVLEQQRAAAGRPWRTRPGSPTMPFDSGSAASQKSGPEPVVGREPDVVRCRDNHGSRPRHPSGSPSGRPARPSVTPPSRAKHSASIANVVAAFSSAANRTNRHLRPGQHRARRRARRRSTPQSMTRCSPGDHTAGGGRGGVPPRQSFFAAATRRRKLRSDPAYPAAWATGSSRFALIRPFERRDLLRDQRRARPRSYVGRALGRAGAQPGRSASDRSMTRLTVLWVVPHTAAAPR